MIFGAGLGAGLLVGCADGAGGPDQTTTAAPSSISSADVRLQELTNSCGANQAQDFFKVINAGTTPIPASDVSIKIWVDDTSGSNIVPRIDTGGCLLDGFGSCVHQVAGVTATATQFAPACGPDSHHQANWEITITNTDPTTIGAGLVWSNIQLALHLANFGNFSPGTGDWYSECLSGNGFANVAHAAVYVHGNLVTSSTGTPPSCRAPSGTQPIPGELPPAIASGSVPLVGPLPGDTPVHLMIGLPLQNQAALQSLIQQVYDPRSPQHRQFLTPDQFGASFGASPSAYNDLISFAQSNGLTVDGQYAGRSMLAVSGPASAVESAFFVTLNQYSRPDGTTFYAPANEPSANLAVPVLHLTGLDNFAIPQPAGGTGPSTCPIHPGQDYVGSDFRTAYLPGINPNLDGFGQTIGLLEVDRFLASDPGAYANAFLSGVVPPIVSVQVPTDASPFAPTTVGEGEVALDMEMVMAMAPRAAIRVYEQNPSNFNPDILLQQMADDRVPIISSSWSWTQPVFDPNIANIFQQYAVQGQSFFQASMDHGAYLPDSIVPNVPEPIILSPLMTVTGGTILTTDASTGYVSETTWNDPFDRTRPTFNAVSGGGFCNGYTGPLGAAYPTLPIPSFQVGINPGNPEVANNPLQARMIPDVSMIADQLGVFADNFKSPQQSTLFGCTAGTSAAAPLWAAMTALMELAHDADDDVAAIVLAAGQTAHQSPPARDRPQHRVHGAPQLLPRPRVAGDRVVDQCHQLRVVRRRSQRGTRNLGSRNPKHAHPSPADPRPPHPRTNEGLLATRESAPCSAACVSSPAKTPAGCEVCKTSALTNRSAVALLLRPLRNTLFKTAGSAAARGIATRAQNS